jgi:hypothetical protein
LGLIHIYPRNQITSAPAATYPMISAGFSFSQLAISNYDPVKIKSRSAFSIKSKVIRRVAQIIRKLID